MNTVFACYCASTYANGTGTTGGDAITNVTLNTLNNSSNGGATATPSPYYTFYNAVTVPNLTQGSGQTISISFGTDGSQFSGVWIDYNQDGDLIDAGEFVANSTVTAGVSGTSILNFTVPVGATLGNTLMRVRGGNDSVLTNTPCGASSSIWGETEDYLVNITPCIAPSISTQPLTQSVCENANVTFSVTAAGTGLTYQWKKEGVDIPTATSASYTITGALVAATGNYTVLVTGACGTLLSDVAVLTVTANSSLPTEVVSACDTYTWAANGAVYTTSGIYTNTVNCVTSTLDLTINTTPVADAPANVTACDSYTLPALTVGNYFTGAGGTGTALSAGNSITSTQTIYVYAETGTTPNCTDENSFTVTITTATISGATTQVINGGVAADATIEDIVVTSNGTVTWFASSSDAISNINPLPAGTQLVDGNVYYGVTNIGSCRSADLGVTVTVVLGTSSFDLSQLNYYPNPVKDIFNVKYNKEIISVDVYDLTGRKVIEMKPNTLEVQLNMTNLSSAMYIVRLQSVDGITELKVYKN